jgi:hypothetical protein
MHDGDDDNLLRVYAIQDAEGKPAQKPASDFTADGWGRAWALSNALDNVLDLE